LDPVVRGSKPGECNGLAFLGGPCRCLAHLAVQRKKNCRCSDVECSIKIIVRWKCSEMKFSKDQLFKKTDMRAIRKIDMRDCYFFTYEFRKLLKSRNAINRVINRAIG
jgi:hypothetical protein